MNKSALEKLTCFRPKRQRRVPPAIAWRLRCERRAHLIPATPAVLLDNLLLIIFKNKIIFTGIRFSPQICCQTLREHACQENIPNPSVVVLDFSCPGLAENKLVPQPRTRCVVLNRWLIVSQKSSNTQRGIDLKFAFQLRKREREREREREAEKDLQVGQTFRLKRIHF